MIDNVDMTAIHEHADGTLLVTTINQGLFVYLDKRWYHYNHERGRLPTGSGFFITEDQQQNVWVTTHEGLYRFPFNNLRRFEQGKIDHLHIDMLLNDSGRIIGAQKAYCCTGAGNSKGYIDKGMLVLPSRMGVIMVDTRNIV